MYNFISKILIYLLILSSNALSDKISEIDVSGNQRISKQTILVLGNISIGDDFNSDKINDSLKNLYKTNFFSDVIINLSDGLLKINVKENPIIEDIEIIGIKNKSFVDNISESIVLKNRMSFTEEQLKKDITLIKNILKSNGFYFAEVESSLLINEEVNSVRLKLDIDRGNKARIKFHW